MSERARMKNMIKPEVEQIDKSIFQYVLKIRLWYLLCPLLTILFMVMGWETGLKVYEYFLILLSLSCIGSEICHKSTWWDKECMELQDEIRETEKVKRGKFYVRPILIGLPAILVVLLLNIPQMYRYILMLI